MRKSISRSFFIILSAGVLLAALFASASAADTAKPSANAFAIPKNASVHISYPSQKMYAEITAKKLINAVNALPVLKKLPAPSKTKASLTFITVNDAKNYEKHTYGLCPNELRFDKTAYKLTKTQYESLKKILDDAAKKQTSRPQWLVWMNPNRVAGVYCRDGGTELIESKLSKTPPQRRNMIETLRLIEVKPNSLKTYKTLKMPSEFSKGLVFELTFDNNVVYRIMALKDKLYVQSNDMDYGCQYTLANNNSYKTLKQTIQDAADAPDELADSHNPMTGKPVIYLYPEKTQDVSVKLNFKGEICYTYPEYNGGWNVTASPDGTLINKADGTTHYYLFWDGNADFRSWDMSAGFVVKGGEIQKFFEEKLPAMGLTPREYNDFITYWTPILAPNKLNLISFSTTEYEKVAPLNITPAPDTVLRVHMLYKALDAPVSVKPQTLPKAPERLGFTVVEWGATRVY